MFVKTAMTWPKAERHCQLLGEKLKPVRNTVKYLGANLASVHSYEEFRFLQAVVLINTGSFPLTWIGGYDAVQAKVEKDRLWFWSDGSKFDHESWAEGEPTNHYGAREPCIQMNFGGTVSPLSFIKFNFFRVRLTNKCDLLFYFVFPLKLKTAGTMNHVGRAIPPCAP
uniref:C-type lectin domain-containing protein n=1 Tax=Salmo trutta TaxID=8032 RepID=A0A674BQI4_SALTR